MARPIKINVTSGALPQKGTVVVFASGDGKLSERAGSVIDENVSARAMKAAEFKGGLGKTLDLIAPEGTELDRLIVVGLGEETEFADTTFAELGGKLSKLAGERSKVAILLDPPEGFSVKAAELAGDVVLGLHLGAYRFDRYKTKRSDDDGKKAAKESSEIKISLHTMEASAVKKAAARAEAIASGAMLARDLVNEPANILTPVEFANRVESLEKVGCKVTVLNEAKMKKEKMGALLGVAQGSPNPPRMAIIEWKGGKAKDKPLAFIGKGVTFDTGGISLKPGAGMGDMKGDMGGAAAVTGLMHALASRKAKANVIGIVVLVENMPDGLAQRPGDIVTSMSGQTIEVLNTDAEGRLILADALWYCKENYDPRFMIDLATLTGAILVALGSEFAGMFSNDDGLAEQLTAAGNTTGEKVWRMPLAKAFDKMIDTKNADMKNIGGRHAGSSTAAQFLQRFVGDVPWVHLDIAGTAMNSPQNDINQSWASGYGVRLLDRFVADNYE